jgi:hypothetical protein
MKIKIISNGIHEYTFKSKDDKYVLKYSKDEIWYTPNEKIIKAKDDGNGVIINNVMYDYADLQNLFIFLKCLQKCDINLFHDFKLKITKN